MSSERMQDFVEQLEANLRVSALRHEQQRKRQRRLTGVGAAGAAVIAAGGAGLGLSAGSNVDVARAAPPVTARPVETVGALRHTAPTLVSRGARLGEVRSITAPGGNAYLVPITNGWCLVAPDPATERPEEEHALSCVSDADFMVKGIWLHVASQDGGYLVVAPPAGARPPEIARPGSAGTKPMTVRAGVALESSANGATAVLYDRDNAAHEVTLPDAGPLRPDADSLQDCGDGEIQRAGTC